jgi:enoyl-CoA hydratase/carnithine racemase
MSQSLVLQRVEGPLLHVTLNRPEKRNALTPQMLEDIAAAVRSADDHADVRAVIVSAAGPIFSAGIDLAALLEPPAGAESAHVGRRVRRLAERLQHALNVIEATEVPVIGALQGQVLGLGLELALAFDLRVAATDLMLSIPESRLGLVADVGGTTRLARTVGPSRAKDLLLTARAIDANEALQWGLVNRVAPPPELLSAAVTLGKEIARNAPLAVGMAKLIVDQGDGLDKHTQMAIERWAQSQLLGTEDVREAVTAFLQKRPAEFKGR